MIQFDWFSKITHYLPWVEYHSAQGALFISTYFTTLQWHHNEHDGISNHQRLDCLLNRLFKHRSKKTSKLHATDLCEGNSLVTGEFPSQRTSNTKNASIWWCHHEQRLTYIRVLVKNCIIILCGRRPEYSGKVFHHHDCLCAAFVPYQAISSYGNDYVG